MTYICKKARWRPKRPREMHICRPNPRESDEAVRYLMSSEAGGGGEEGGDYISRGRI
jgi:hypothetical protein